MHGYLVDLRIVKRSHDHRGLIVFVPDAEADSEDVAAATALSRWARASEAVSNNTQLEPENVHYGHVSVEWVARVGGEKLRAAQEGEEAA